MLLILSFWGNLFPSLICNLPWLHSATSQVSSCKFPFTINSGIPFVSNWCLMTCFLDSLFYFLKNSAPLFLWSISYSNLGTWNMYFWDPQCPKCLFSALQMTILQSPVYFLEILCSYLLSARFQPQNRPSCSLHYIWFSIFPLQFFTITQVGGGS